MHYAGSVFGVLAYVFHINVLLDLSGVITDRRISSRTPVITHTEYTGHEQCRSALAEPCRALSCPRLLVPLDPLLQESLSASDVQAYHQVDLL